MTITLKCIWIAITTITLECTWAPITPDHIWKAIGFLGQGIFFGRWVIQWIASEKKAETQIPIAFWYMSVIGGLITLAYAIYEENAVFITGQSVGTIVYIRNLILNSRKNQPTKPSSPRT